MQFYASLFYHLHQKLFGLLNIQPIKWNAANRTDNLNSEHQILKDELLFQILEDDVIEAQITKLKNSKTENKVDSKSFSPIKPETNFEDFSKMDIRVATILEAEKIAKTDKLIKLKIDTGVDVRTIVSGIAEWYKPEEIIGQQIVMLANLAPRKIKGIESQGMILMAENENGELSFVSPTKVNMNNGSCVK